MPGLTVMTAAQRRTESGFAAAEHASADARQPDRAARLEEQLVAVVDDPDIARDVRGDGLETGQVVGVPDVDGADSRRDLASPASDRLAGTGASHMTRPTTRRIRDEPSARYGLRPPGNPASFDGRRTTTPTADPVERRSRRWRPGTRW